MRNELSLPTYSTSPFHILSSGSPHFPFTFLCLLPLSVFPSTFPLDYLAPRRFPLSSGTSFYYVIYLPTFPFVFPTSLSLSLLSSPANFTVLSPSLRIVFPPRQLSYPLPPPFPSSPFPSRRLPLTRVSREGRSRRGAPTRRTIVAGP